MSSLLAEYVAGATFGAALFSAGVFAPETIIAQMQLKDFTMVKAMMGASATSALAIYVADRSKYAPMKTRSPQNIGFFTYDGNIIGGSLIGAGMALTGACPGTVFVQAGAGLPSGTFVLLGGILGGLAFVAAQPNIIKFRDSRQRADKNTGSTLPALTIPETFNISPLSVLIAWEILCFVILQVISSYDNSNSGIFQRAGLVSPVIGGILIGAAQAGAIALTGHSIGTSGAFEDIGRWLRLNLLPGSTDSPKRLLSSAVVFGAGIVSASALLARVLFPAASSTSEDLVTPAVALVGGATMAFGSRLAGGCTSGHGISGLATFSWASLVSVASMFGAGVLTAALVR